MCPCALPLASAPASVSQAQSYECHCLHPWGSENSVCGIVLYAERFKRESFTPSEQTRRQHEQNLHRRKFCWRRIWTAEMLKLWILMKKRPETNGTPHRWPPTKGDFHSVITWQHWCSLLHVMWVTPRERFSSSPSLQGTNVTVYTLEASMENPSLWVNGQGGRSTRAGRTFIVENYTEDEFGRWKIDEVTGVQGYIDDGRSCFLDMGRQRVYLAVQTVLKVT